MFFPPDNSIELQSDSHFKPVFYQITQRRSPTLFLHSQIRFLDNVDLTRIIESGANMNLVSLKRNLIEGAAERIVPIAIVENNIFVNDLFISIINLSHRAHSRKKWARHKPHLIDLHGQRAIRTFS